MTSFPRIGCIPPNFHPQLRLRELYHSHSSIEVHRLTVYYANPRNMGNVGIPLYDRLSRPVYKKLSHPVYEKLYLTTSCKLQKQTAD
jgi:hypothetical protein